MLSCALFTPIVVFAHIRIQLKMCASTLSQNHIQYLLFRNASKYIIKVYSLAYMIVLGT